MVVIGVHMIPLYYIVRHSGQYYEGTGPLVRVSMIIGTVLWFEFVFASTAAALYLIPYTIGQFVLMGMVTFSAITARMWPDSCCFEKKV